MKKKFTATIAVLMAAILALGLSTFVLGNEVPEDTTEVTALFNVLEEGDGFEFSMVAQAFDLVVYVNEDTVVYFEDYVPLGDDDEGLTLNARVVLFGRTLSEVLENRNMIVHFYECEQNVAVNITILFETAVHLAGDDDYVGIMTLPGEIDWDLELEWDYADEYTDIETPPFDLNLNGEILVDYVMLEGAPAPFIHPENSNVAMVPLRAVATALGYDVSWNSYLRSVQLGVAIHLWIGSTEVHFGRMAPLEISVAPVIVDDMTFVPHDFFRTVLGQVVYIFEGQVVIAGESDMH